MKRVALLILAVVCGLWVSSRGGKHGFVYRSQHDRYRALRRKGYSKKKSARIANAWAKGTVRHRGKRK